MNIKNILGLALIGILSTSQANAISTLSQFGAIATISNSVCAGDFCGDDSDALSFLFNLSVDPVNGGVTIPSASAATGGSWPTPPPDSAQANAAVSGGLSVPLLTAGAASSSNSWIAGQALVVQGYDYTGSGTVSAPETLLLDWDLSGTIVNPDNDSLTGLTVFVGFFESDGLLFPTITNPFELFGTLAGLAIAQDDVDNVQDFTSDGAVSEMGTLSIDVADGAQFYLIMGLMASAGGTDAMAESLSTLTASFSGNPSLAASINSVPIPAAVWLFAPALLGLFGLSRCKNVS